MVQQSFLNSTKLQQVASKKRWGHDDAMVILDAWKRSGLSIAEFSREIGIHAWVWFTDHLRFYCFHY